MKKVPISALLMIFSLAACAQQEEIKLPDPVTTGGMPLMDALKNRKTARDFSEKAIDNQMLSNLLWAASGINRPDKRRTAPTARNQQELEIYCAMENGLFLWEPERNVLISVHKKDIREKTGKQDFVKTVPLNLIFVCNNNKFEGEINEMQKGWIHVDAGYISENIYLFCTSFGLSTVVRGLFDRDELAKAMHLPENSWVVITQSVGYPK